MTALLYPLVTAQGSLWWRMLFYTSGGGVCGAQDSPDHECFGWWLSDLLAEDDTLPQEHVSEPTSSSRLRKGATSSRYTVSPAVRRCEVVSTLRQELVNKLRGKPTEQTLQLPSHRHSAEFESRSPNDQAEDSREILSYGYPTDPDFSHQTKQSLELQTNTNSDELYSNNSNHQSEESWELLSNDCPEELNCSTITHQREQTLELPINNHLDELDFRNPLYWAKETRKLLSNGFPAEINCSTVPHQTQQTLEFPSNQQLQAEEALELPNNSHSPDLEPIILHQGTEEAAVHLPSDRQPDSVNFNQQTKQVLALPNNSHSIELYSRNLHQVTGTSVQLPNNRQPDDDNLHLQTNEALRMPNNSNSTELDSRNIPPESQEALQLSITGHPSSSNLHQQTDGPEKILRKWQPSGLALKLLWNWGPAELVRSTDLESRFYHQQTEEKIQTPRKQHPMERVRPTMVDSGQQTEGRLGFARNWRPAVVDWQEDAAPRNWRLEELALSIEMDSSYLQQQLEGPRTSFFQAVRKVDADIRELEVEACQMHGRIASLRQEYEELDSSYLQQQLKAPQACFQTVSELIAAFRELEVLTCQMDSCIASIQQKYESAEAKTLSLLDEAHQLRSELKELQYLDDLIFLLQGQLDHISLRSWPFKTAHLLNDSQEINLVI